MKVLIVALLVVLPVVVLAQCPYLSGKHAGGDIPSWHPPIKMVNEFRSVGPTTANGNAGDVDWKALEEDLKTLLKTEQADVYPLDFGSYGPFFIRQGWHCSGSYRGSDGRGGCDGARQRFEPELSWADNTNLDKAKRLLWPIKQKYGAKLSWGDLIIFTANTAIASMGGPVLGFCAGRQDDLDGSESRMLGPTSDQQGLYPCATNGECDNPFGTTTIGLIYVNPEGHMGIADPKNLVDDIRDTFGAMSMNDEETVALIGGGHAFGKSHGACPLTPADHFPNPSQDPLNPWPAFCGKGKVFTSGFEGAWSQSPTQWGNYYFKNLLAGGWKVHTGPGGHQQWASENVTGVMMLTSDLALLEDESYRNYVMKFAENQTYLDEQFSRAWYKLTTRDAGPWSRCVGPHVPPPQPFQNPLPDAFSRPASIDDIVKAVNEIMNVEQKDVLPADDIAGSKSYAAVFAQLAFQSASTLRLTDFLGGANGARIRFAPQSNWPTNKGLDAALKLLAPVQKSLSGSASWADIIVGAGTAGLRALGVPAESLPFCSGRSDAADGSGSSLLSPNGYLDFDGNLALFRDKMYISGLPPEYVVALSARPKSAALMSKLGFTGSYPSLVNVSYFANLLNHQWQRIANQNTPIEFKAVGANLYATQTDIFIAIDDQYKAIAQRFAQDEKYFQEVYGNAWTNVMNGDRFSGPLGNVCAPPSNPTNSPSSKKLSVLAAVAIAVAATTAVYGLVIFVYARINGHSDAEREPINANSETWKKY